MEVNFKYWMRSHWQSGFERCPRVMLWFAEQCGLPAKGLYDAEQISSKAGIAFGVSPLSPDLS